MTAERKLRRCPTCGQKVDGRSLRQKVRDYRWLTALLPGNVGACDGDAIIEQHSTGRILVIEAKRANEELADGQFKMLQGLLSHGIDVWLVRQLDSRRFDVYTLGPGGFGPGVRLDEPEGLQTMVASWWLRGTVNAA